MGCVVGKSNAVHSIEKSNAIDINDSTKTPSQRRNSLTPLEVFARIICSDKTKSVVSGNVTLRYAFLSQRGFYPDALNKPNQDAYTVITNFSGLKNNHLFGVFDGHGKTGDMCSLFAQQHFAENLMFNMRTTDDFEEGFAESFLQTNAQMHQAPVDDKQSGTTAVCLYFNKEHVTIGNVGDSRAFVAYTNDQNKLVAAALTDDQTPYRKDERERCKKAGARILTRDQLDGNAPWHENWGPTFGDEIDDEGDPPRVWHPEGRYPGTAFTRSLGDSIAESLGVIGTPEISTLQITSKHKFVIIASDGVFEFLTNQAVVDIVKTFEDPLQACRAVVAEAYELWLRYEVRTDDITVICIMLDYTSTDDEAKGGPVALTSNLQPSQKKSEERPVRRTASKVKRKMILAQDIMTEEKNSFRVEDNLVPKSLDELDRLRRALKPNFLFTHLSEAQRENILKVMEKIHVQKDQKIIAEGDKGDYFYVIDTGEYEVRKKVMGTRSSSDDSNHRELKEELIHVYSTTGGLNPCFGDLALLYSQPREASVYAKTDGVLWGLSRAAFRSIVMKSSSQKLMHCLQKVEILKSLDFAQMGRLTDLLAEVTFEDGAYIIEQGQVGNTFYIISRGSVRCTIKTEKEGIETEVLRLYEYDYFGERALLSDQPRAANVIAVGKTKCLHIGRDAFEEVLGPLQDIIDRDRQRREALEKLTKPDDKQRGTQLVGESDRGNAMKRTLDVVVESLLFCQHLFQKDYISFDLYVHKDTQRAYTIKSFHIAEVLAEGEEKMVLQEKEILAGVREPHPFVPVLSQTFRDEQRVHMLFSTTFVASLSEFMSAGAFQEGTAKFYGAALILALQHVHRRGIVYRGLEPDLILLNDRAYPQLLDFRIAKKMEKKQRTYTLCGSPEYMAPEQVQGIGHSFEVDYWTLGVLLYECLVGIAPFNNADRNASELEIFSRIIGHENAQLQFPPNVEVSKEAQDFLVCLLRSNPRERMKYPCILSHAWLKDYAWHDLANKQVASPHQDLVNKKLKHMLSVEPRNQDTKLNTPWLSTSADDPFRDF